MVNIREPLINVVRTNKPKALTGLSQKACGPVWELSPSPIADRTATGEQAGPTPSTGLYAERGKPVAFPDGKVHRKVSR
jgi:hypothetical protein